MEKVKRKSGFRSGGWIVLEILWLAGLLALWLTERAWLLSLFDDIRLGGLLRFISLLAVLNLAATLVKYSYKKRQERKGNVNQNFYFGIDNIRILLTALLIVFTFFQMLGVEPTKLFTSLSIVAAAIAIVSKEFVNDMLVGLYYSFSNNFEINDYVKFNNQKGKLIDIGLLKVKLLNDNDDVVILPNGKVYAEEIVNYTRRDARVMSIDFQVDIKSVRGIDALEQELIAAVGAYAKHIDSDSYHLKIVALKKDYLDLKFQYRLQEMDVDTQKSIKRETVRAVYSYVTACRE